MWDPVHRELRKFERGRKGWKDEPEAVERLQEAKSVTLHRWGQEPMQTATGQMMPASLGRVAVAYEAGGVLDINENDRACAQTLAAAIAESYGLELIEEGAPGGRRGGNLPSRDQMGRLVNATRKTDVTLDEDTREITIAKRRGPFGKKRRTLSLAELRRLELGYEVAGPTETFTVWGLVGFDEERVPLASYSGFEGWADPQEWREFADELAQSLGVELTVTL
jgi:hypothetical protein